MPRDPVDTTTGFLGTLLRTLISTRDVEVCGAWWMPGYAFRCLKTQQQRVLLFLEIAGFTERTRLLEVVLGVPTRRSPCPVRLHRNGYSMSPRGRLATRTPRARYLNHQVFSRHAASTSQMTPRRLIPFSWQIQNYRGVLRHLSPRFLLSVIYCSRGYRIFFVQFARRSTACTT